jgi:hypothetical protein
VSGDGVPGEGFLVNFSVDTAGPVPVGVIGSTPPGGAHVPLDSGLATPGDVDSFTFGLAAGQTIAATFTPNIDWGSNGIILSIELADAAGNVLARATAPGAAQDVMLPAFTVRSAGTYTVSVHALFGTGRFRGEVVVDTPPGVRPLTAGKMGKVSSGAAPGRGAGSFGWLPRGGFGG